MATMWDLAILLVVFLPVVVLIGLLSYGIIPPMRKSWREAQERAERLVGTVLSADEYRQWQMGGFLDVPSPNYPKRVYRIPQGAGTVMVLEKGRCVARLCAQPCDPIPERETVLVHKLMIEGDEQEYLRIANHFPC